MSTTKQIYPYHYGEIIEGKLYFKNKEQFDLWLKTLSGPVKILIQPDKKTRSNAQNNYYWGVIIPCGVEATGLTPLEVHAMFGHEFLRSEKLDKLGKTVSFIRSTSDLNTAEAEAYYAKCRELLSMEYQYYTPLPNEAEWGGQDAGEKQSPHR